MDAKFSSTTIPKCLDQSIYGLLEEFGLSSWKIYGGISAATVVIRFGHGGNSEQTENIQAYRRKPNSNVQRDINRLEKWIDKKHVEYQGQVNEIQMPDQDSLNDISSSQTPQVTNAKTMSGYSSTPVSGLPLQVDGAGDSYCKDEGTAGIHPSLNMQQRGTCGQNSKQQDDKAVQYEALCGLTNKTSGVIDMLTNTGACSLDGIVNVDTNTDTCYADERETATESIFLCISCDSDLAPFREWQMCTLCSSNGKHFGICPSCYAMSKHKEHYHQLSWFKMPSDPKKSAYCDSCGYTLNDPQLVVYSCTACDDDYLLCKRCFNRKRHTAHRSYLTKSTVADVLEHG